MLSVDYRFSSRQTRDFLEYLGHDLEELRPLLEMWLNYYRSVAQPAIFAAHEDAATTGGGGHGHPQWQALTARYLASDEKRRSPHPRDILQLTGDFKADITGHGTMHTIERFHMHASEAQVVFGSSRQYPVWAGAGQGGPRQAMYLTAETVKQLDALANHYLSELIVKARVEARKRTDVGERAARRRWGV